MILVTGEVLPQKQVSNTRATTIAGENLCHDWNESRHFKRKGDPQPLPLPLIVEKLKEEKVKFLNKKKDQKKKNNKVIYF